MTEAQAAREILEKELGKIDAFERLSINGDFLVYLKEIDKRKENLRDLLEITKDEDLANVRGQLQATRGVTDLFHQTTARRAEVLDRIKELQDAER